MASVPIELANLLGQPLAGASRIVLQHARRSRFRSMVILEILVGIPCLCVLIPLMLLVAMLSEDSDLELPSIKGRFYERWHEISVAVLDTAHRVIASARFRPAGVEEGDALVATVLAAADREGLLVVETIEPAEPVELWYGGRPLLAHPEQVVESGAAEVLRQAGFSVAAATDHISLSHALPGVPRLLALLLMIVLSPFVPLALVASSLRAAYRHLWADLRGEQPAVRTLEVRAHAISVFSTRSGVKYDEMVVDGRDLIGVTFSPTLGFDADVTRHAASLRFIGRSRTLTLHMQRLHEVGRAVRDWLVAGTLRLRAGRPELGLPGRATHCPYCRALYEMLAGSACPNCGAPAAYAG